MATLDLVQLRWQQIRMAEASQLIEAENIALKKEIKELNEKLAAAATQVRLPDPNAEEEKMRLKRGCSNMKNTLMRMQSELVKLKLTSVQEINWLIAQKQLLSNAFTRYVTLYDAKNKDYKDVMLLRDELQEKLSDAQREMKDGVSTMSQEYDKLKVKYKTARSDLIDTQAEINRLKEANKVLDDKCSQLSQAKMEADAHYNVLNKQCLGMQALVDRVRAEGEAALAAERTEKLAMQDSYEKIVGELGYENEFLRKTCAEQEEQIAKLTNALIGNKSHFARYVEVKTENLTLQSKLEAVTKGRPGLGSGSAKADPHAALGLPAHQRRLKGGSLLANAGAAAVSNTGNTSNSGVPSINSGAGSGNAPGAAATHWASAVRQPSPRTEQPAPTEAAVVASTKSVKPHAPSELAKEPSSRYLSAGIQMMFPATGSSASTGTSISGNAAGAGSSVPLSAVSAAAHGPYDVTAKVSPQTSPRNETGNANARSMSKGDSTASLQSRASTLAEPNIFPPPATALKPARSSYAGGVARLSLPRGDSAGGSATGTGSRHGSARTPRRSYLSEEGEECDTPTGSAVGRLRGAALSGSRDSPMSSPRTLHGVGKTDSARSMLTEPVMLPPPTAALQPTAGPQVVGTSISEGSTVSRPSYVGFTDSIKSTQRKSLRVDGPAQGAQPQLAKVELSFGGAGSSSGKQKHVI